MKTADFCEKYEPCHNGKAFDLQYETMSEVWEKYWEESHFTSPEELLAEENVTETTPKTES